MDTVDAELPVVVSALLGGPYPELGGAALADVIGFAPLHAAAEGGADDLLANLTPEVDDVRVLLAAAGRAFARDPARHAERDATGGSDVPERSGRAGHVREGYHEWARPLWSRTTEHVPRRYSIYCPEAPSRR